MQSVQFNQNPRQLPKAEEQGFFAAFDKEKKCAEAAAMLEDEQKTIDAILKQHQGIPNRWAATERIKESIENIRDAIKILRDCVGQKTAKELDEIEKQMKDLEEKLQKPREIPGFMQDLGELSASLGVLLSELLKRWPRIPNLSPRF